MGSPAPDPDTEPLHPHTYQLIDPRRSDWTEGRVKTDGNVLTGTLWPSLPDVSEHRLRYITAQWKLLKPSPLGSTHGHDLVSPIEIAEPQLNDFTAAKSIK